MSVDERQQTTSEAGPGARSERGTARGSVEVVIFGRRTVLEALRADGVRVEHVLLSQETPKALQADLRGAAEHEGVRLERVPAAAVHGLSREPRHDQGVAARAVLHNVCEVASFLQGYRGRAARQPCRLLALDGITNPQNVGMIVRSSVAFGLEGVVWPLRGSPWLGGLAIRASAGAIFQAPILRCPSLVEGLWELQAAGFELAGLTANGGKPLGDFAPRHRTVYVLGSETHGLSDDVKAVLDTELSIPLSANVDSLNVSVAAGLVCYHAAQGPR